MLHNRFNRPLLIMGICLLLGYGLAVLAQYGVKQEDNNYMRCLETEAKGYNTYGDCRQRHVETSGWPFASRGKFLDGSTKPITTEGCINPTEIYCGKNRDASRYRIQQIYFNAVFLSVFLGLAFVVTIKLKKLTNAHSRD
jgi:hypothetical protein